jgi:hypothetical protein
MHLHFGIGVSIAILLPLGSLAAQAVENMPSDGSQQALIQPELTKNSYPRDDTPLVLPNTSDESRDKAKEDEYAPIPNEHYANNFNDVKPDEWIYGALKDLAQNHSCSVFNSKRSPFSENRAIGRFEAATLIYQCLKKIGNQTDQLKRLQQIFAPELDKLMEDVARLEARVDKLSATQFSPTAKFSMLAFNNFTGTSFSGSSKAKSYRRDYGALYTGYSIIPSLNVSWGGTDMLTIIGLASNYDPMSSSCGAPFLASYAPQCGPTDNQLTLWRMFYSTPLTNEIKVTVGGRLYAYDFLPVSNAVYGQKAGSTIGLRALPLDILQYAGVPGVYPYVLGPGFGVSYIKKGWSIASGYVSSYGSSSLSSEGLFGEDSGWSTVTQLAYTGKSAGFQVAWTHTSYPKNNIFFLEGTPLASNPFLGLVSMSVNTAAAGGYWYIRNNLSVSGGIIKSFYKADGSIMEDLNTINSGDSASSFGAVVTLQWERAISNDGTLGISFGIPGYLQSNSSSTGIDEKPYALIGFMNWSLTDNLQFSPSIYWLKHAGGNTDPNTSSFGFSMLFTFFL